MADLSLSLLGDILPQVFTMDFWGRMLTNPFAAVVQHPRLALESGLVAGATTAAIGGAIMAAPVVASAAATALGVGKVAAAPVLFAAKHPILSYLIATNADLPTEIVRAFGASRAQQPRAPGPATPPPMMQPRMPDQATSRAPARIVRRGRTQPGLTSRQQFNAMFGVN